MVKPADAHAAGGRTAGKAEFYPLFDWTRLVLAMAVAFGHSGLVHAPWVGDLAVQVFFALSGWLIGGILLDTPRTELPHFYYNRVMRIWAPYAFAIALVFGVSLFKEPADADWFEYLFYDLTFTHNLFITPRIEEIALDLPLDGTTNGYWSLSVEEQFYLLAPLIILFFKWGRTPLLWAAIAALMWSLQIYGSIAFGVLAIVLKRRYGDWHLRPAAQIALGLLFVAAGAAIVTETLPYGRVAPIFSISTILLLARTGKGSPLGSFAGGISYPLYLNHWVGIFIANEALQKVPAIGFIGQQTIGVVANLAFASLAYRAIDMEVRKRRGKLYTPGRGRAATAAAFGLIVIGVIGGLLYMLGRG